MADTEKGWLTSPYFPDLPDHVETLLSKYHQNLVLSQKLYGTTPKTPNKKHCSIFIKKTGRSGKTVYIPTIKIGTEITRA